MPEHPHPLFHRYEIVVIATRDPESKHLNGWRAIIDQAPASGSEDRNYRVIVPPNDDDERWRESESREFREHELFEWGQDSYFYQSDIAWRQSLEFGQEIGVIGADERPAARGLPPAEQIIRLIEYETDDWRPLWHWLLDHAYVHELIKALRQTNNTDTRAYLCYLLGWRRSKRAVPYVAIALHDPADSLRAEAADALAKIRSESAGTELLTQLAVETGGGVKQMIALALGACGYRPSVPRLINLLKSDSGTLRGCAAWSLGELRAPEGESPLSDALETETDEYAIQQMKLALARIREQHVETTS